MKELKAPPQIPRPGILSDAQAAKMMSKSLKKVENQVGKLETEQQRLNGQLSNANFVEKAPTEKVQEIRERVAEIETQITALRQNLEALK